MSKIGLFRKFLEQALQRSVRFTLLCDLADEVLKNPAAVPVCDLTAGLIEGRSGTLVKQKCF